MLMKYVRLGSVLAVLLLSWAADAAEDGKWQEAEAYVSKDARLCSAQDKTQRATERVMGCTQAACKQAKKLAEQTLGHEVSHRCKSAIRVGECQKGPAC